MNEDALAHWGGGRGCRAKNKKRREIEIRMQWGQGKEKCFSLQCDTETD